MHLLLVGGCFAVQHNISPHQLYHHVLGALLAPQRGGCRPTFGIVRYERFGNCLAKLAAAHARQPAQVLVFHVRAEPVMRLAKLYYRYRDARHRLRHSLTLPWRPPTHPAHYDQPPRSLPGESSPAAVPQTRIRRALRQLNLRLGAWVGNRRRALQHYQTLVADVAAYCQSAGIRLLVVGPVSRPCTAEENRLSGEINAHFAAFAARHGLAYVPTLGETDAAGQALFLPGGVYVSPAGHRRVAHLLHEQLTRGLPGPPGE